MVVRFNGLQHQCHLDSKPVCARMTKLIMPSKVDHCLSLLILCTAAGTPLCSSSPGRANVIIKLIYRFYQHKLGYYDKNKDDFDNYFFVHNTTNVTFHK